MCSRCIYGKLAKLGFLLFSTLFTYPQSVEQDQDRSGDRNTGRASLANTDFLPTAGSHAIQASHHSVGEEKSTESTKQPGRHAPPAQTPQAPGMRCVRKAFTDRGFSEQATNLLMGSWRNTTRSAYSHYIEKWRLYAEQWQVDIFRPPIEYPINFLANLFDLGASHSSMCMARSALSCLIYVQNGSFGNLPIVKRFMKGVFEARPALPRYAKTETWDPQVVLNYLEAFHPNADITLRELTYKLVTLLAILTGQRCQTLKLLCLENLNLYENKCVFIIDKLLKQSRKGTHIKPIELLSFPGNSKLCVIQVLKTYLNRTRALRKETKKGQLLISFQAPHKPVSKDTISRWIKSVLKSAGIDRHSAHSTRSASTSAALRSGMPLPDILAAAGWSNENTFAKFYNKRTHNNLGNTILEACLLSSK